MRTLRAAVADNDALLTVAVVFALGSQLVGAVVGWRGMVALADYLAESLGICVLVGAPVLLVAAWRYRLRAEREAGGHLSLFAAWGQAWRDVRRAELSVNRLAGVGLAVVAFSFVFATFTGWKTMVGVLVPFSWDGRFWALDRALHLGQDPWRLIQPLLGTPAVTRAVERIYFDGWLVAQAGSLGVAVWAAPSRLRTRFLVTFALLWPILGSAMALAFSSAGPGLWSGRMHSPVFVPLLEYLHTVSATDQVSTFGTGRDLWALYEAGVKVAGSGISAFPSLHIAVVTLLALAAWRVRRWLGVAATLFAVVILLGSVHLAWHYAVDGYAAALLTAALWWAVGRAQRRAGAA